jgi:FdrA protein
MSKALNRVRRGFYADSVALMRIARELGAAPGVLRASLMIGTPSNKGLLADSGLLAVAGKGARPDDLVIAVRAKSAAQAEKALGFAEELLSSGSSTIPAEKYPTFGTFSSATAAFANANLALISVPGEFAALEARRALERGLHAMVFSDNVPLEEEVALKEFAARRGLLMMGPDCGTALIAGIPIAFANAVPRGAIGIVSASGTGLQEVSTLLARAGHGVSHGIGVGGRDLSAAVGGRMTLAALDALEADAATKRIIVISKPPAPSVTAKIVARAKRCRKPVTLCLLGSKKFKLPKNVRLARTLEEAAGGKPGISKFEIKSKGAIRGLFCGGTLCAEAQIVLMDHGLKVSSNVPVPDATERGSPHALIDLGDDDFTRGRPHPMIEPELRNEHLERALREKGIGAILLDVVIGYGAHRDPAGLIGNVLEKFRGTKPVVIASVTGTEADPQVYSRQVKTLRAAGVIVAASNAAAARLAALAAGGRSPVNYAGAWTAITQRPLPRRAARFARARRSRAAAPRQPVADPPAVPAPPGSRRPVRSR